MTPTQIIERMFKDAIEKHVSGGKRPRAFDVLVEFESIAKESRIPVLQQVAIFDRTAKHILRNRYAWRVKQAPSAAGTFMYEFRRVR